MQITLLLPELTESRFRNFFWSKLALIYIVRSVFEVCTASA